MQCPHLDLTSPAPSFSFFCGMFVVIVRYIMLQRHNLYLQQGRISDAEASIKKLYGKERVAEVMRDLNAAGQGSIEPEAGWFDLFSSRYWKGI